MCYLMSFWLVKNVLVSYHKYQYPTTSITEKQTVIYHFLLIKRLNWLVQYKENTILFYWILIHVGIILGVMERWMQLPKFVYWEELHVLIPFGDFKKHINVLLKCKWKSKWDEAINNKLHEIHPHLGLWPGGLRITRCFSKDTNWSHSLISLIPFDGGRPFPMYSLRLVFACQAYSIKLYWIHRIRK